MSTLDTPTSPTTYPHRPSPLILFISSPSIFSNSLISQHPTTPPSPEYIPDEDPYICFYSPYEGTEVPDNHHLDLRSESQKQLRKKSHYAKWGWKRKNAPVRFKAVAWEELMEEVGEVGYVEKKAWKTGWYGGIGWNYRGFSSVSGQEKNVSGEEGKKGGKRVNKKKKKSKARRGNDEGEEEKKRRVERIEKLRRLEKRRLKQNPASYAYPIPGLDNLVEWDEVTGIAKSAYCGKDSEEIGYDSSQEEKRKGKKYPCLSNPGTRKRYIYHSLVKMERGWSCRCPICTDIWNRDRHRKEIAAELKSIFMENGRRWGTCHCFDEGVGDMRWGYEYDEWGLSQPPVRDWGAFLVDRAVEKWEREKGLTGLKDADCFDHGNLWDSFMRTLVRGDFDVVNCEFEGYGKEVECVVAVCESDDDGSSTWSLLDGDEEDEESDEASSVISGSDDDWKIL